jgi:glycerol uptake facilitator-like aquaporin
MIYMNSLKYLVELIGTYVLVLTLIYIKNPLIIGSIYAVLLTVRNKLSYDIHLNPAATLSYLLIDNSNVSDGLICILLQFLAGYLAYFTYKILK